MASSDVHAGVCVWWGGEGVGELVCGGKGGIEGSGGYMVWVLVEIKKETARRRMSHVTSFVERIISV